MPKEELLVKLSPSIEQHESHHGMYTQETGRRQMLPAARCQDPRDRGFTGGSFLPLRESLREKKSNQGQPQFSPFPRYRHRHHRFPVESHPCSSHSPILFDPGELWLLFARRVANEVVSRSHRRRLARAAGTNWVLVSQQSSTQYTHDSGIHILSSCHRTRVQPATSTAGTHARDIERHLVPVRKRSIRRRL